MQEGLLAGCFAFSLAAAMALSSCEGQKGAQVGADKATGPENKPEGKTVIAMLPKLINIDYFDTCKRGAMKAAEELGVTLIFNGPTEATAEGQNQFIETWIRQKVQAICIAPNQPKSVRRFVEKAKAAGIKILTWDTDAPESGRDLMVNQVDDKVLGEKLMDDLARQMGEEGKWAIVIGSLDAANLNTWRRYAEARAKSYPRLQLVQPYVVTNENENEAREKVETLLNAQPELKGLMAFDSNSVPGAAEALKRSGKAGKVALVGNSTPSKMRPYIKEGTLESFFLWDPAALGSLTVRLAKHLVDGKEIKAGEEIPAHGKLVFSGVDPKMVILSDPIRFTKENIDNYTF
jgi:ABC-type sugar transport system substrate-binding protein